MLLSLWCFLINQVTSRDQQYICLHLPRNLTHILLQPPLFHLHLLQKDSPAPPRHHDTMPPRVVNQQPPPPNSEQIQPAQPRSKAMSSNSQASSSSASPPAAKLAVTAPPQSTNANAPLTLAPEQFRFSEEVITVTIGLDKISFHVHKDLLRRNSTFFAAILATNTAKPAREIQITLEHVQPAVFEGFLSWLYTRDSIFPPTTLKGPETRLKHLPWSLALDLYALGRYLGCPMFGNTVIYSVRVHLDARMPLPMPSAEEVTAIYQRTVPDCGLRNLVVLMHTTMARSGGLFRTDQEARLWMMGVPAEFLGDMVVKMTQQNGEWTEDFWRQPRVLQWITDR